MLLYGIPAEAGAPTISYQHNLDKIPIVQDNWISYTQTEFKPLRMEDRATKTHSTADINELKKLVDNNIYQVIQCESGWNQNAIGKAGEIGLCQFKIGTWNYFNRMRGTNLDIYNPAHQIDMILWAWDNNLQSHWSCY